jgi:hypothetical protein
MQNVAYQYLRAVEFSMASLREQSGAVINVCKIVMTRTAKDPPQLDATTRALAQAILEATKAQLPDDKILAAISINASVTQWTEILTAMELVMASLPSEESTDPC